jgi:hypothetical protein
MFTDLSQFSLLTIFWKNKCKLMSVWLCTPPPPRIWMPEHIFMKLCIRAHLSSLLRKSFSSVSVCTSQPLLGNGLLKRYHGDKYSNRRIFGRIISCVVHLSKESRRLVLPRTSCFLFDRSNGPPDIENDLRSLNSSVSITGRPGFRFPEVARDFSVLHGVQTELWGPPSFLSSGQWR